MVASLERGDRDLDPWEFAAMCSVFRRDASRFLGLDDSESGYQLDGRLVPAADVWIDRDGGARWALASWLEALEGSPTAYTWQNHTGTEITGLSVPGARPDAMTVNMAASLNVDVDHILTASATIYGHPPEVERDRRLGDATDVPARTLQARRGHVTRAIRTELQAHLGPGVARGARAALRRRAAADRQQNTDEARNSSDGQE